MLDERGKFLPFSTCLSHDTCHLAACSTFNTHWTLTSNTSFNSRMYSLHPQLDVLLGILTPWCLTPKKIRSYFGGSFFNRVSWKCRKNSWASCSSPNTMFPEISVQLHLHHNIIVNANIYCYHYTIQVLHQWCWVNSWWLPFVDILTLQDIQSTDGTLPPCPIHGYIWFYLLWFHHWLILHCDCKTLICLFHCIVLVLTYCNIPCVLQQCPLSLWSASTQLHNWSRCMLPKKQWSTLVT